AAGAGRAAAGGGPGARGGGGGGAAPAPPLVPGVFGRVVALNLLDAVASPRQLLSVLDGLCRPGGEIIVSSPYAWQSSVMAEHERLGGGDPPPGPGPLFPGGGGVGTRGPIQGGGGRPWDPGGGGGGRGTDLEH